MDNNSEDTISIELSENEKDVEPPKPVNPTVAQLEMKFEVFCNLLEKLSSLKTKAKLKLIEAFFSKYLMEKDPYPIIRLMLPYLDRERGNYGLKEQGLAKLYAEVMLLPQMDADRLKHFKNPTKQPFGAPSGDFVSVVLAVMEKRCRADNMLSISEVNSLLDDLCKATDNQAKKIILSKIFNSSTLLEHKWLLRIILKDLKIGIGHETILKNYHPDAITLYNVTSDLKEVLSELNSKDAKLGSNKFRLFYPIKPMLAGKLPLKQINTILDKTKVILETKFDGERIQVHVKEDVIKFFSRNSHNYTHIYGPKMSDIIKDNINAKSVILDGEMVVYDTNTQKTLPFGQNKTIALSEEKEVDGKHLCYKVFDILYIQGKQGEEANLMNAVIQDRKMVLSRVVKSVPTYLEVVTGKIATKMEEVCEEFNTAIMNNEEGTMVKQYDSIYAPNERGSQWVKLKGEYIDNLGDTLDLVIIGGYFGEGKRTGKGDWTDHITVFLLGIIKTADLNNPKQSVIYPFCKVGTGYSIQDLQTLRTNLKLQWKKYDSRTPPGYMWEWKPSISERPDVYIDDPSKSVVLEIRAGEIVSSDQYPTKYTLRFPRVLNIRYDKNWDDAMNVMDLKSMLDNYEENRRLKRKHKAIDIIGEDKNTKKLKKLKPKGEFSVLLPGNRDTDTTNVNVVSQLFKGMVFYIVNLGAQAESNKVSKQILETFIAQYGGNKVQNYISGVTHVIGEDLDYKTKNLIAVAKCDIYHYQYLIKCIERQELVELAPKYFVYCTESTKVKIGKEVDQYGDPYYNDTDADKLEELIEDMSSIIPDDDTMQILKIKDKLEIVINESKDDISKYTYYMHYKSEMDLNDYRTNEVIIKMKANNIKLSNTLGSTITHIILNDALKQQHRAKLEQIAVSKGMALITINEVLGSLNKL